MKIFDFIFRRNRYEPPTKEQVKAAKVLGIKSPAEMSRKSLAIMIAEAEKKAGGAVK